MSGEVFDVGDLARLDAEFSDLAGAPIDPTTVTFKIKEPDNTVTTYVFGTDAELVKDATGLYHVDWPVTQSGAHNWRYESTGTGQAAEEAIFTARASKV